VQCLRLRIHVGILGVLCVCGGGVLGGCVWGVGLGMFWCACVWGGRLLGGHPVMAAAKEGGGFERCRRVVGGSGARKGGQGDRGGAGHMWRFHEASWCWGEGGEPRCPQFCIQHTGILGIHARGKKCEGCARVLLVGPR
jgi:hypothetical protein